MLVRGGGIALAYDPLLRLYQASTTRWAYDGANMIAEYDTSNALLRRFVHGPGIDEPLVWYEGTGTTDRRFLHADERGSIIAISDGAGAVIGTNRYDEYGVPESPVTGRFQYTGQVWIASLALYCYAPVSTIRASAASWRPIRPGCAAPAVPSGGRLARASVAP